MIASWARYAEGVDEEGEPIDVVDRRKEAVMAGPRPRATTGWPSCATPTCSATSSSDERFTAEYVAALDSLHERGARATADAWEQLHWLRGVIGAPPAGTTPGA